MDQRRKIKKVLVVTLLAATIPFSAGCELGYVVRQGLHQVRLLAQRRPVGEVLADPSVDAGVKDRIRLVQEVRAFGENHLGLRTSHAYETFIEIQGDAVAYVVSACPKDRLEPYLWRFPIVGQFPYKGFFRREEAEEEKTALQEEGLDAHLSAASAYSALGWFSDPLYSSMLRMEETALAYTILHEMVHRTIFFRDQVDFNEQLATLVGWQGTVALMESVHGKDSKEARRVSYIIEDERRLGDFLRWAHERLADFYALPMDSSEKIGRREAVFGEIRAKALALLPEFRTDRYLGLAQMVWNNASLLAFWRYRYNTAELEALYERLGGDLRRLVEMVKSWREKGQDPRQTIERDLSIAPSPLPAPGDLLTSAYD